jgi:hypothetical protein
VISDDNYLLADGVIRKNNGAIIIIIIISGRLARSDHHHANLRIKPVRIEINNHPPH